MSFSNEEWEEIRQDIPAMGDPFLAKYLQGREALIAEEKKTRSDASFRNNLSPIARKACEIVESIRAEEQRTTWTPAAEDLIAQEEQLPLFPGMMFTHAKERMEGTKLWKIVRRMPKGCLLHAHLDAMVDFDFLLNELLKTPGMHLACEEGSLASPKARELAPLSFRYRKGDAGKTGASIWSEGYEKGKYVLLTKAAEEFPDGGTEGFLKWLRGRCTVSATDSVEQHHGVDAIWRKFARCFQVVSTIIHYEPVFRVFLRRLMNLLYADGIRYAEVRFTWPLNYCREFREDAEEDYDHMFRVLDEEIKLFQSPPEGSGFWGLRMIWTSLRSMPTRPIIQDMDNCIATKLAWPNLIAGYDLVGQEDLGRPLKDLLPELFWFRKQCAQEGVNIPLFLHAGECLGDGNDTDNNLFDAILLGTRRIGHAFSLYRHPLLIDMVRDKKILVESCPISNEVLRLCGSITSHPLPALLARGIACALCNDDPAMLGQDTAGMSHDFWQALQGWDNLGLAGLGSLAENSVRWACFEDVDNVTWAREVREATLGGGLKAGRMREWAVEWERFCVWVVTEFGEEDDDDDGVAGGGEGKETAE